MHFPPMPELPPFLSGRSLVAIDGAILSGDDDAAALLQPLRDLGPEMDTFARIPSAGLVLMHMDPPEPAPAFSEGAMVAALPGDAVQAFLAAASAPGLFIAELRHVGGAASRRPADAGAIGAVDADYLVVGIAMVPGAEFAVSALAAVRGVIAAMSPWHAPALALTFVDGGVERTTAFGDAGERLRALKAEWDPSGMFAAGHPVG
ncbi:BBE domain-containing protein [Microbacterium aureliae]